MNFTLAADTFTDPSGGTLAYAATLSNGAPLPSWLNFDPATETFSGLMPDGTKALAINVIATDRHSLSASETFVLSITQAASQFGQAIAGMTSGTSSSTGSLTFSAAARSFVEHCDARALIGHSQSSRRRFACTDLGEAAFSVPRYIASQA